MHRYIAFAWNHHAEETEALAKEMTNRFRSILPGWHRAFVSDGLQVYQTGHKSRFCHAYVLNPNIGVVLGKVFPRTAASDDHYHEVTFSDSEARKIKATGGRHLIERYWGRYIALLRAEEGTPIKLLRDPTGAIPCQVTRFHDIDVACSHISDCAAIGLVNPAINWSHVIAFLWFHRLVTNKTGLEHVSQVRAGECVTIGSGRMGSEFLWNPAWIHDARVVDERAHAMEELRNTIEYCVRAWASCYTTILHQLSGGLDSAIVLASLSRTSRSTTIIGQNFYTQGAEGDERVFARESAQRAGIELRETPLLASDNILDRTVDCPKVATPALIDLIVEDRFREEIVRLHGIEAVFSGQGGDHFFQRTSTALIAAEYAFRNGVGLSLLSIITDTARFSKESIWSVFCTACLFGLLHRHSDPYSPLLKPSPFASEQTRDALDINHIRHPWVNGAKGLPDSKILQVIDIVDSQNFYHHYSSCVDVVHPLISQPIIELCLQIPSYVLTYGGIDRALVRDAFRERIPEAIVARTSKGGTTSYIHRQLADCRPALREFLMDGVLVRQGVLDRAKTESSLTEANLLRNPYLLFPMLTALRAEAWSRTWAVEAWNSAA